MKVLTHCLLAYSVAMCHICFSNGVKGPAAADGTNKAASHQPFHPTLTSHPPSPTFVVRLLRLSL